MRCKVFCVLFVLFLLGLGECLLLLPRLQFQLSGLHGDHHLGGRIQPVALGNVLEH